MAATGIQANWSNVSVAGTTVTKVTAMSINPGGSLTEFSGDGDIYPTLLTLLRAKPTFSITTGDIGTAMGLLGVSGTVTATHKDAKGASGGNVVYTISNAVISNVTSTGNHGAYGSAQVSGEAYSTDGITSPISFTRS